MIHVLACPDIWCKMIFVPFSGFRGIFTHAAFVGSSLAGSKHTRNYTSV